MTRPLVSIIITNYNYARYVGQCLASCQQQKTTQPYEIVVVDDGSTDDSVATIQGHLNANTQLICIENSGIEAASNTGIAAARGEYFVRVDADDLLDEDYLDAVVKPLQGIAAGFAYSDYRVIDGTGAILYEESLPPFEPVEIRSRGDFLASGTLYRKAVVDALGAYDTRVKNCGLENYKLVLRLLQEGVTGRHIPGPRFSYRRHALNISVKKHEAIITYGRELFAELGLGKYRTNPFHPYHLAV